MVKSDDYSIDDAQPSLSKFSKNWDSDEELVWRLEVVEHVRTGVLPFGTVVLKGNFDGKLTIALEG